MIQGEIPQHATLPQIMLIAAMRGDGVAMVRKIVIALLARIIEITKEEN